MAKRVKVTLNLPVIESLEEANATLAEIADLQRSIDLIKAGLNEKVDTLKKQAESECSSLVQSIGEREQALARFAEENKDSLFKKPKSREVSFGELGFRDSSKLMLLNRKWSWEKVLAGLKNNNLSKYLRLKEEVDKEALKKLSNEKLKPLGVKVQRGDSFFYEIKEENVGAGV